MTNPASNKNTPQLRFPEFSNDGEWEYLSGDKIFGNISNKTHNSDLPILAITQEFGAIPRDRINYNVVVTDKSVESYKVVEVGDFIISLRSFQGGIEYSNYTGICSPAYIILKKKIDVSNLFFKHFFKTNLFIKALNKNIEGIRDGKMVSYTQFSELKLPKPSISEQQKIADCLSSLDELIAAQAEKVEALKTHQKALMQQLFPTEGETIPKLRFKEFENDGEWRTDILGKSDISVFVRDKTPLKKIQLKSYISTENLLPNYTGVTIASKLPPSGSFTKFQKGDILISNIRPYLKKVWVATFEGAASNDVIVIRASSRLSASFLSFILKNDAFINYIMKSAKGVKMPRGDKSSIEIYTISFPSRDEQQKIADCLSSIDEQTAAEEGRLSTLKDHKKGLMQSLFPNPQEKHA